MIILTFIYIGTATKWLFIQIHIKQKWYFPNWWINGSLNKLTGSAKSHFTRQTRCTKSYNIALDILYIKDYFSFHGPIFSWLGLISPFINFNLNGTQYIMIITYLPQVLSLPSSLLATSLNSLPTIFIWVYQWCLIQAYTVIMAGL